jgi:ornithine cyclodeaminase/alanine dehydrogenase-like protein (mu-crystallin family)
MSEPFWLGPGELSELVSAEECVEVLDRALRDGVVDPEADGPRVFRAVRSGQLLLMPSDAGAFCGVKLVTIAPDNPATGQPAIQGVYALFESNHLRPLAVLDAAELTLARTPAITALAARHLLASAVAGARQAVGRLVVIGTGPQAIHHVRTLTAVVSVDEVVVIGRRPESAATAVEVLRDQPVRVRTGDHDDLSDAGLIVCATSSRVPVLDDEHVGGDVVVCAIGSHGLDRREIPPALTLRSDVVVEGRGSAMREAGDLIPARSEAEWAAQPLTNLAELVTGGLVRRPGHPALFCGVGMAWQDLVLAGHLYAKARQLRS